MNLHEEKEKTILGGFVSSLDLNFKPFVALGYSLWRAFSCGWNNVVFRGHALQGVPCMHCAGLSWSPLWSWELVQGAMFVLNYMVTSTAVSHRQALDWFAIHKMGGAWLTSPRVPPVCTEPSCHMFSACDWSALWSAPAFHLHWWRVPVSVLFHGSLATSF